MRKMRTSLVRRNSRRSTALLRLEAVDEGHGLLHRLPESPPEQALKQPYVYYQSQDDPERKRIIHGTPRSMEFTPPSDPSDPSAAYPASQPR
jgi:hypothetical protein